MSVGLVANETIVMGTSIKAGWLTSFDLVTFEQTAKSSTFLPEAVTCMCTGEDAGTIVVGMNDSRIACIRAGRAYLEVLTSVSIANAVKTFHSISRTSRGDFMLGTTYGVCFVKWYSQERKFEVVRQTPTTTSGPPLSLLNSRLTLASYELSDDMVMTSDYNQPGYYLVNRATKDIKKIEEVISDNRGCYDI